MSKARAVFFDIDHTLFSHTLHDVPASAYTALEKLKQNGSQDRAVHKPGGGGIS